MADRDTLTSTTPTREALELRLCRIRVRHRTLIEAHDLLMEEMESTSSGDSDAASLLLSIGQRLLDKAKDCVEEMAAMQPEAVQ